MRELRKVSGNIQKAGKYFYERFLIIIIIAQLLWEKEIVMISENFQEMGPFRIIEVVFGEFSEVSSTSGNLRIVSLSIKESNIFWISFLINNNVYENLFYLYFVRSVENWIFSFHHDTHKTCSSLSFHRYHYFLLSVFLSHLSLLSSPPPSKMKCYLKEKKVFSWNEEWRNTMRILNGCLIHFRILNVEFRFLSDEFSEIFSLIFLSCSIFSIRFSYFPVVFLTEGEAYYR